MNWVDVQNQQRMMDVVRQMKEIPELPSEAPKDVTPLTSVEFPESGGVLTHMGGMPYPYKGFPFFEFVDKIDVIKKISRAFLSGLYHQLKTKKLFFATLLPALWLIKPIFRTYLYVVYRLIDRFKLKKEMYSDAVREIYRAFTGTSEFQNMFRDALCMTLEMDNAYRYRFQDVIVNLNKKSLEQNPRKELLRLMEILASREKTQDVKDTWFLIRIAISGYLMCDREFRKMLVDSFLSLNLEKIALDDCDKTFAGGRKDYVFGFMVSGEKNDEYFVKFNKWREGKEEITKKIQDESTKAHEEMFARQKEEQTKIARDASDEEIANIQKEIAQKTKDLNSERDGKLKEIVDMYANLEKEIPHSYLTDEQKALAIKHLSETEKMNEEYTQKLNHAQEAYQLLCPQQNFISNKDLHPLGNW